ncbi:adhesion G protein-coupled receptor L4-like [Oculina patagonica]
MTLLKSKPHNIASYLRRYLKKETGCKKLRLDLPSKNSPSSTIYVDGFGASKNLFEIRYRLCSQSPGNNDNGRGPFLKCTECSCKSNSGKGTDENNEDDQEPLSSLEETTENFITSVNDIDFEEENATQHAVSLFSNTITEFINASVNGQDEESKEDVLSTMLAFEDFIIRFAEKRFNDTSPKISKKCDQFDFRVKRIFMHQQTESEFLLNGTKGNYIKIPSRNLCNGSVVLGIAYRNIHELFITNHSATNTTNNTRGLGLNTIIMSAIIYPPPKELLENVTLVFENLKAAGQNRECVFWNFSEDNPEGWSGKGCRTRSISNSQTECVCNHLTHFAVLMDYTDSGDSVPGQTLPSEKDDKILTILTHVGMALSLTGVVLTIISYLLLTDMHAPLSHIRVSLAASIGAGHVIFLAGIDATENKGACVAVAALMQYFLVAAFCWMLVEGIYLYLFVVKVYNVVDKIRVYHLISWGFPAIIVAMSLSIAAGKDGIRSFISDKYCWISSANNLIWIFVSFVGLIELLNVLILVRVIKEMTTMQHIKDNQTEQIRIGIRACVVLVPLLGVTWLFGFLLRLHIAFAYIFVILNSTQGFFVFLPHCLRNSEIRERFKRRYQSLLVSSFDPDKRISRAGESCDVELRDDDENQPSIYEL